MQHIESFWPLATTVCDWICEDLTAQEGLLSLQIDRAGGSGEFRVDYLLVVLRQGGQTTSNLQDSI